jgi:tRNA pseudouridine38-40 synthase
MHRYRITIEYLGTEFCGWQRQKNGISIQETIENAIFSFSGEKVEVFGSGRTDAGVHARGQVAHFDMCKDWNSEEIFGALNYHLKNRIISIISCEKIDSDFHARFSARERSYKYIILNRSAPPAIDKDLVWHIHKELNLEKMIKASKFFIGTHDFSSFRASECQASSPVKTINKLDIIKIGDYIEINISAKSFLHHMVRNIVGTLVLVGHEKISSEDIVTILEKKQRSEAGPTAPACGLYFMSVTY